MANNKIILKRIGEDPETLIDLTADTVTAEHLLKGVTAHAANGQVITGTYESAVYTIDKATETMTIINPNITPA